MSKRRDDYERSKWGKFQAWVDGTLVENKETKDTTKVQSKATIQTEKQEQSKGEEVINGASHSHRLTESFVNKSIKYYDKVYKVASVLICLSIIAILLYTVSFLPPFGNPNDPDNNIVSQVYLEEGMHETGAVNIVTGMILDYRAFDTFGESNVLYIAACTVLILLRIDAKRGKKSEELEEAEHDEKMFEPKNDLVLQKIATILVPPIILFGVYVVLNGHISPGGGFSGGAIIGAGLILYLNAFGFEKTQRFFTMKTFRNVTFGALTFYALSKSYSFFTGANHLESGISAGVPGRILSAGLILPLNICVGLVVACTMYAFYALFRKGGM